MPTRQDNTYCLDLNMYACALISCLIGDFPSKSIYGWTVLVQVGKTWLGGEVIVGGFPHSRLLRFRDLQQAGSHFLQGSSN